MRVSPIKYATYCCPKIYGKKSINFEGKPEVVPSSYYASNPAIYTYSLLKNGSYLDSHDDRFNPDYKRIRENNFSNFYTGMFDLYDKKSFIEEYKKVTGFPNLAEVSKRIEDEFVSSIKKAEEYFDDERYRCIRAGYDSTCSVGKGMALPGSDLDKSYIVLKGSQSDDKLNKKIVNDFSAYLWNITDQRILSYNHDTSFPTIMTTKQVKDMMDKISSKIEGIAFDNEKMIALRDNEYMDLERAAEFNIIISKYFPKNNKYINEVNSPNKEEVKNFAYFIESLRDGKKLILTGEGKELRKEIKHNPFFKYSNVAQMRGVKKAIEEGREQKTKIIKRKALEKEFDSLPITEQYDFIVNLIKYCSEDQNDYPEYFKNDYDVKEKYKPLLGLLTKGDRNALYIPEFSKKYDGYRMKYGKESGEYVDLYRGFSPNVLWVDAYNKADIESIEENIETIKKIEFFKDIDRIQCKIRNWETFEGFYPICHKTEDGISIQEMMI